MQCAVKQAATGEQPIGRAIKKVNFWNSQTFVYLPSKFLIKFFQYNVSQKEKDTLMADKDRMTEHFIPVLPLLLAKVCVGFFRIEV